MNDTPQAGYQVLARKYRPETFADLVGQDAMVRTLKNAFEADRIAQAFIMTGIRGTGKTTVGRLLADLLGWKWLDSDDEIQQQTGRSIANIFASEGEEGFRDLESQVVKKTASLENHVISLGGGAVLREENRDLISAKARRIAS